MIAGHWSLSCYLHLVSVVSLSIVNWKKISATQRTASWCLWPSNQLGKPYSYRCSSRCFTQHWVSGNTYRYIGKLHTDWCAEQQKRVWSRLVCGLQMDGGQLERRWEVEKRRSWVDVLCISEVRNCESCTDGTLSPSSSSPSFSLLCPGTDATWHDLPNAPFTWAFTLVLCLEPIGELWIKTGGCDEVQKQHHLQKVRIQ